MVRHLMLWTVLGGVFLLGCSSDKPAPQAARPSPTATATVTPVFVSSPRPSVTPTATASRTPTATLTSTPSLTPTLAQPVITINALLPGMNDNPTPLPPGVTVLPDIPAPPATIANATLSAAPHVGWVTYESDHPAIQYSGNWEALPSQRASRGQYH